MPSYPDSTKHVFICREIRGRLRRLVKFVFVSMFYWASFLWVDNKISITFPLSEDFWKLGNTSPGNLSQWLRFWDCKWGYVPNKAHACLDSYLLMWGEIRPEKDKTSWNSNACLMYIFCLAFLNFSHKCTTTKAQNLETNSKCILFFKNWVQILMSRNTKTTELYAFQA